MKKIVITVISILLFYIIVLFTFQYLGIDYGSMRNNITSLSFWSVLGVCFAVSLTRNSNISLIIIMITIYILFENFTKLFPVEGIFAPIFLFTFYRLFLLGSGVIVYFVLSDIKK